MRAIHALLVTSVLVGCASEKAAETASPNRAPASAPASQAATTPAPPDDECGEEFPIPNRECCGDVAFFDGETASQMAAALGSDVAPFLFDNTVFATGGLIRVYRGTYEKIGAGTKFGLMDTSGKLVVPFEWDFIDWMCKGQARACIGCTKKCAGPECEHWGIEGGSWSCIDGQGRAVACADIGVNEGP